MAKARVRLARANHSNELKGYGIELLGEGMARPRLAKAKPSQALRRQGIAKPRLA
jgi:hypothetical protein